MVTTKSAHSPRQTPFDKTRDRIEQWRKTRLFANTPMPATLWRAAVAAAQQHGLYPTARALRVDYGALKTHVQAAGARSSDAPPTFVELPPTIAPAVRAGAIECVFEREAPSGIRRVRLSGLPVDTVLTLARLVWSEGQ
jgi:hypothetical protein